MSFREDGCLRSDWVNSSNSGVLISIFSIQNYVICTNCRGWNTSDDTGANKDYYLYISKWYRTISSGRLSSDSTSEIISVASNGYLNANSIELENGSVQFLELCYLFILAEALLQKTILELMKIIIFIIVFCIK